MFDYFFNHNIDTPSSLCAQDISLDNDLVDLIQFLHVGSLFSHDESIEEFNSSMSAQIQEKECVLTTHKGALCSDGLNYISWLRRSMTTSIDLTVVESRSCGFKNYISQLKKWLEDLDEKIHLLPPSHIKM